MESAINVTLQFTLAMGQVNLNEIVYRLKQLRNSLMLQILEKILTSYDDLIAERLTKTDVYPSKARKGLGRHVRKGDVNARFCRGRKIYKRGHRHDPRHIATVFGTLRLPIRVAECCKCGARYCPLLSALQLDRYVRKEVNFEQQVIEAVIDTNYRRLIQGQSIDISVGGVHNLVVGSDLPDITEQPASLDSFTAIMADGTGVKQYRGRKGELRLVVGITANGHLEPLGTFVNTDWAEIEQTVKQRIKDTEKYKIPFIYDGEPGLDNFLADVAESQRCLWHAPRGLYHALWEDGLKKKDSQSDITKLQQLVGIELPTEEFELLKPEDIQKVKERYEASKAELNQLIETFKEKGYRHGTAYVENLARRLFTHVELWLKTGVIAPKTVSLLERLFREIGRRLKKIAWGWSDLTVSKLCKMIFIKQYSKDKWKQYWKDKLGIKGYFKIQIQSVVIP
jgi:hypothetical protein